MFDEGYTKYQCNWLYEEPLHSKDIRELNEWRDRLYKLGLIGQYSNGIGFGNISIRLAKSNNFIISGTNTGGIPQLDNRHYTKVIDFDWDKNYVTCCGPIQASSEALTHGAVYTANSNIHAVIHVHHLQLWRSLMDKVPTTAKDCAYGTPEMAKEIIRLCRDDNLSIEKIVVMSGHEEGIISFGTNLAEAAKIWLNLFF
jgi:ribulose-5-phosphate 4-epimerase/fuculose-1-phosphate aldolase